MSKTQTQYETNGKLYYERRKAEGWASYLVFGPPELIRDVKEWMRDYKVKHDLYKRPEWGAKPRR